MRRESEMEAAEMAAWHEAAQREAAQCESVRCEAERHREVDQQMEVANIATSTPSLGAVRRWVVINRCMLLRVGSASRRR